MGDRRGLGVRLRRLVQRRILQSVACLASRRKAKETFLAGLLRELSSKNVYPRKRRPARRKFRETKKKCSPSAVDVEDLQPVEQPKGYFIKNGCLYRRVKPSHSCRPQDSFLVQRKFFHKKRWNRLCKMFGEDEYNVGEKRGLWVKGPEVQMEYWERSARWEMRRLKPLAATFKDESSRWESKPVDGSRGWFQAGLDVKVRQAVESEDQEWKKKVKAWNEGGLAFIYRPEEQWSGEEDSGDDDSF